MNDEVKQAEQQLATDLDKMRGSGEQIVEALITGIVLLKREVATLTG
jgi:predicted phosphoribosyltransferase